MRFTSRALYLVAGGAAIVVGTGESTPPRATLPGVRYSVDTTRTEVLAAGIFSTFSGRIEFAGGRGRIDVAGVAVRPTRSVNDVTVGRPLVRPGDYYLFDSTGYIVVRTDRRTFSSVAFTTSTYRHGNVREAWDGFFPFGSETIADIPADDAARLLQHGTFTIRWHLDRVFSDGPAEILARGRTIVADAPRGEATIVRWTAPDVRDRPG